MPRYKFLKVGHFSESSTAPVLQIHPHEVGEPIEISDAFAARCEKHGWAEPADVPEAPEGRDVPELALKVDGDGNPVMSQESESNEGQEGGFLSNLFGGNAPEGSGDGDED